MTFLHRDLQRELSELSRQYPVVTLMGPRQSGKTTLVRQVFHQKSYVSLENPDDRSFAESDPRAFLESYPDGLILDEIQRLPILLSYIQGIVDEKKQKGMYILTGSHQHELHQSISQSLAGRTAVLKLLPLSMSELPHQKLDSDINRYLFSGMYPSVIAESLDSTKYYRSYLQTYIERDLRQMIQIKDLSLFQRFIKLCASRIGQLFNASSLSNEVGVSSHTIESWLSILEASFVIFRLQPYFENFGKRIIKSSKLYFYDVGLARYCLEIFEEKHLVRDPLRGALVENFIIAEVMKQQVNKGLEPSIYFYRDSNQREVDLLIKRGSELIPIEIKSSKTFHKDFLKGLDYFHKMAEDKVETGYLIYTGDKEQRVREWQVINYRHLDKIDM